jgi:hypothetical protein
VDKLKDSGIFLAVTEGFYCYLDAWFRYRCHSGVRLKSHLVHSVLCVHALIRNRSIVKRDG